MSEQPPASWSAFPLAVARSAGFDYALLEALADPGLLDDDADLEERYPRACARARAALVALLDDPSVREGIAVLAPDVLRFTAERVRSRPSRTGDPDKHERKLALFLQRLTAKCDTNAIAGTVGYVPLAPETAGLVPREPLRRGFVAHWVLSELALLDALGPEGPGGDRHLTARPRPGPAAALLPPRARRAVHELVDGAGTWARAAERRPARRTDRETVAALHRRAVVWSAPVLPVSEPDALRAARAVAPGLDVGVLAEAAEGYAHGDADRKRAELERAERWAAARGLTEVRRGAGRVYADRTVLYAEHYDPEAARRWPHAATTAVLNALRPALELSAATGVWAREQARARAAADFAALLAGRDRAGLDEVLRGMPGGYPVDIGAAAPVTALLEAVARRGPDATGTVRLDASDVDAACAAWLPAAGHTLLASPDVFLAPGDGDPVPEVVVGEVHAGLTVLGNLLCFLPDRDAVVARARSWLTGRAPDAARLVNVTMGQRYGKVCHLEVMPRTLELTGPAAPGREPIPVDAVEVTAGLDVRLRGSGEPVELMLASGDGTVFSPLAPPAARLPVLRLPGAAAMPRIAVGRLVLQRATWWFPAERLAELGRGRAPVRYRRLRDFVRGHGLPRRTFVRAPGEPKPVHLDAASPLLADAVTRLLAGAGAEPGAEVAVTEMLPDPGRQGGRMHEFRLSCVREPVVRESVPRRPR
ncbi:hypothetical protein [Streptomyces sp. I05A-00742]|uniref:hypothetical protein n=1 Tax=Streptomyces sp. I05A-00742 TaxID=2732853 RepID=UPI001488051A|nr:hypothetical protein [Streptomyces sp. I05A-00742]